MFSQCIQVVNIVDHFLPSPSTADEEKSFDLSLVVILLMAVGTVLVGSLW